MVRVKSGMEWKDKISKNWLYNEYVINKKNQYEIARELECSQSVIYKLMKKYEITARSTVDAFWLSIENGSKSAWIFGKRPDDWKDKMSVIAKDYDMPSFKGRKHPSEAKMKNRLATLKRYEEGKFPQTRTAPHKQVCKWLDELDIPYIEEKIFDYFSVDVYILGFGGIEVQGDYWHCNPKVYDKPINESQRKNIIRDKKKLGWFKKIGLPCICLWENDIMNNNIKWFKNQLQWTES